MAIFVKVLKSIIFLVKSFLATFIDVWQFFSGHTVDSYQLVTNVSTLGKYTFKLLKLL